MRSVRLDPELDALVVRAAAREGASVSEFLRRAALARAEQLLTPAERIDDLLGSVRSAGGAAERTGAAFTDLLGARARAE